MNRRGFLSRVALGAGAIALLPAARVLGAFKPLPVPAATTVGTITAPLQVYSVSRFREESRKALAKQYAESFERYFIEHAS